MKYLCYILLLLFPITSCHQGSQQPMDANECTAAVLSSCEQAQEAIDVGDADSAFSLLLKVEPLLEVCDNNEAAYIYNDLKARLYERKNLFTLQKQSLLRKLSVATGTDSLWKQAVTHYELGVANYAQVDFREAVCELNKATDMAQPDSADFIARCYVMLSQIYLQTENYDSVTLALENARHTVSSITNDAVYRLSEVYLLYNTGQTERAVSKINEYMGESDLYSKTELLTLLVTIYEQEGQKDQALEGLHRLVELGDSAAQIEASENTAAIHRLRHEEQMRQTRTEANRLKAESHARKMTLIGLLAIAVTIGTLASVWYARRAVRARQSELEALRLAEEAQANEEEVRTLNQDLQKRYYTHLYAILLPILNAKQTKTGFIDLNESSWKLIEENTDLVLPHFTRKLRKNHPTLADDDVRFCCLVAMQVPNPVIANIYGIAPSSVSVRKLRMKKKLDENIVNETLENYLYKYSL